MNMKYIILFTVFVLYLINAVQSDCPKGFTLHGEWCYVLLNASGSWGEASHYCEAVGAQLATIENAQEQQYVEGYLGRLHDSIITHSVWIGGTDLLEEGTFVAPVTLEPLTYFNWAPGEPDNLQGQHCMSLFRDQAFKWDDNNCEAKLAPLCKRLKDNDGIGIVG